VESVVASERFVRGERTVEVGGDRVVTGPESRVRSAFGSWNSQAAGGHDQDSKNHHPHQDDVALLIPANNEQTQGHNRHHPEWQRPTRQLTPFLCPHEVCISRVDRSPAKRQQQEQQHDGYS
jgi:hypothetical protein